MAQQPLRRAVTSTVDNNGNIQFVFESTPQGLVYMGTVWAPASPVNTIWNAYNNIAVGDNILGTWLGKSGAIVQTAPRETLVVRASGLTGIIGVSFTAYWVGIAISVDEAPPFFPTTWSGSIATGGGTTGIINVEDEGVLLPNEPTLNFVGAGVTATDDPANNRTNVTIPGGSGGRGLTLVVAASDALASSIFGADYVCAGANDNLTIDAAIAFINTHGGKGRVQLTEGTFHVSDTVNKSAVAIVGITGQPQGTIITADVGHTGADIIFAPVVMSDIMFQCNHRASGVNLFVAVSHADHSNVSVDKSTALGYWIQNTFAGVGTFTNIYCSDSAQQGFFVSSIQCTFIGCDAVNSGSDGWRFTGNTHTALRCGSAGSGAAGITCTAAFVNLIACNVSGSATHGVVMSNEGVLLASLIQANTGSGVIVSSNIADAVVAFNTIDSNASHGVFAPSGGTVLHNRISSNGGHGITTYINPNINNARFDWNHIVGNTLNGINHTNAPNPGGAVAISYNYCENNGQNGILIDADCVCSYNNCSGNNASGGGFDDIVVQAAANITWNRCHYDGVNGHPNYGLEITNTATAAFVYGNDLRTPNVYGTAQFVDNGVGTLLVLSANGQRL